MTVSKKLRFYLLYTALFAIVAFFGIWIHFLLSGNSLFVVWDSFDQQYLAFIRIGAWIRDIMEGKGIVIWDPSIGYGGDFFISLSPFVMDPMNWLSALIPARYSEAAFTLFLFSKAWLCGISFSVLAFSRGHKPYATLCGMMTYAFSGCVFLCIYQSQFFMPVILFPLMITGVDFLLEKNKPGLYVASLSCSALYSFYHTYSAAFLLAGYVVIRLVGQKKEGVSSKTVCLKALLFLAYSVLSAGIAAVSLIPMAIEMLSMSRMGMEHYVPLLYSPGYYWGLLRGMIQSTEAGADCRIGWPVLGLLSVFLCFLSGEKKSRAIRTEWILGIICLCIPAIGYFLNGFGYVTNRWVWGFSLLMAYIVTMEMPEFKTIPNKRFGWVIGCSLIYLLLVYFFGNGSKNSGFVVGTAVLLLYCLLIFFLRKQTNQFYERAMICLSCVAALAFSFAAYGFGLSNRVPMGTAWETAITSNGKSLLDEVDTSDGTRYSSWGLANTRNASWLRGVASTSFYMSLYNDYIDQFHNSIALRTAPWPFGYDHLDMRSELHALLGVNHLFTGEDSTWIPVGYDRIEARNAYRPEVSWTPGNKYSLFYLFDQSVSYGEYEKLTPYERQQLLMKAVVLDEKESNTGVPEIQLQTEEIPFSVKVDSEWTAIDGNEWIIRQKNDAIYLEFEEQPEGELYLYFDDLRYTRKQDSECYFTCIAMHDDQDIISSRARLMNLYNHSYGGKHQWMFNLGRISQPVNRIRISVDRSGTYSFKGIHIYNRNEKDILHNIAGLKKGAEDILFRPNQIDLSIKAENPEFLFASIPYSQGWKAAVDGKETPVLRADTGFMALELQPGIHHIKLSYMTQGLPAGALVSFLSFVLYFGIKKTLHK